jgi:hypothetical protein
MIFWTGSGGCGVMESEKLQGCTTLIPKVLIHLILQLWNHFIPRLIALREEFICAIFDRLVNMNRNFSLKYKDDIFHRKMKF